jgi:serine/threonine protein kinase
MMVVLNHDFIINSKRTYDIESSAYYENLIEKLKSFSKATGYSSKLIEFIEKSLHPNPKQRFSLNQLMTILCGEMKETISLFEHDYVVKNKINRTSLTILQEFEKKTENVGTLDITTDSMLNVNRINSIYLAEHKDTMKRYNAFCITFLNESEVARYYEHNLEIFNNLDHPNLVSIRNVYLQRNEHKRFEVYVVKV